MAIYHPFGFLQPISWICISKRTNLISHFYPDGAICQQGEGGQTPSDGLYTDFAVIMVPPEKRVVF